MDDVKQPVMMTQKYKIDYIINASCDYFGLARDVMINKTGTKDNIHRLKRYIALVLTEETEATQSDIAILLGFYSGTNTTKSIKKIREELSDEFFGVNKTKKVYNDLLTYLNLKQ